MKACEAMTSCGGMVADSPKRVVDSTTPLLDVLPRLLDSPDHTLGVTRDGNMIGTISADSMLEALGRLVAARDDSSTIVMECAAVDYSASHIARAVEDADVHLVDLLSSPAPDGKVRVTLRIRSCDATAAAHNLQRYGYTVLEEISSNSVADEVAMERLLGLRALLNV